MKYTIHKCFYIKSRKTKIQLLYTDTVFIKGASGSFSLQNNKRSIYLRTFVHIARPIFSSSCQNKGRYIKKRCNAIFMFILCGAIFPSLYICIVTNIDKSSGQKYF